MRVVINQCLAVLLSLALLHAPLPWAQWINVAEAAFCNAGSAQDRLFSDGAVNAAR